MKLESSAERIIAMICVVVVILAFIVAALLEEGAL